MQNAADRGRGRRVAAGTALLCAMCWQGAAFAQGGPPLITDDPYTPGQNNWEINIAGTLERRAQTWLWETPLLDINYGCGERVQIKYEIPYLIEDQEGAEAQGGVGNSGLGVKWRFLDEDKHGIAMAVSPAFEFNTDASARRRGLVSDNLAFVLPFQIARSFGKMGLNLEIGYALVEQEENEWLYGLAFGYDANENLQLLAEFRGSAHRDFGQHELLFQVGGRHRLTENLNLLLAAGRGIHSASGEDIKYLGYLGLQFTF
jgi:hypothetical protein